MPISKKSEEIIKREIEALRARKLSLRAKLDIVNADVSLSTSRKAEIQSQIAFIDADIDNLRKDLS